MVTTQSMSQASSRPRLLVDVTASLLLAGEHPLWISRVEAELARRLLRSRDPHAVPVVFHEGTMFALPDEAVRRIWHERPTAESAMVRFRSATDPVPSDDDPSGAHAQLPRALLPGLSGRLRWAARASLARLPPAIRDDARLVMIHARQIARTLLYAPRAKPAVAPLVSSYSPKLRDTVLPTLRAMVHPRPGDILFTAGLYSDFISLRGLAELRRRTGLRVGCVCYDLIRQRRPEFNPRHLSTAAIAADTTAMLDVADLIWSISDWTAQELRAFAAENARPVPPIQVIPLGCEMSASNVAPGVGVCGAGPGTNLPSRLAGRSFALAVGTVEPRKNYGLLIRSWQQLVDADPDFPLDLVIVGRPGYGAAASIREIQESGLLNKRVFWLDDCPDAALAQLYAACHLFLYPSFVEGWGLPVSEALSHGREVIASNAGAIPEAASGAALLLDPLDEGAWLAAFRDAASRPRRTIQPPRKSSWDDAASLVLASIQDLTVPVSSKAA